MLKIDKSLITRSVALLAAAVSVPDRDNISEEITRRARTFEAYLNDGTV